MGFTRPEVVELTAVASYPSPHGAYVWIEEAFEVNRRHIRPRMGHTSPASPFAPCSPSYPSPHGAYVRLNGIARLPATSYPSPHGAYLEDTNLIDEVITSYPSPHGAYWRDRVSAPNDDRHIRPRMGHTIVKSLLSASVRVISVPAWGILKNFI